MKASAPSAAYWRSRSTQWSGSPITPRAISSSGEMSYPLGSGTASVNPSTVGAAFWWRFHCTRWYSASSSATWRASAWLVVTQISRVIRTGGRATPRSSQMASSNRI